MSRYLIMFLFFPLFVAGELRSQTPAAAQPGDDVVQGLQIVNGDTNQLLEYYEKLSGKILVRDANIAPVSNLRLVVPQGITRSQALRLIESVLLLNGYSMIKGEDNTVKVLNTAGHNPRSEGVPIYANLADLPKGDEIVSYYMPFRYMNASEAQQVLQAHMPPHNYGAIVPVVSAQAVIVTDNASVIRQLVKLKELMDVPPAQVVSRFVPLQRADAERVADMITKLIDSRKKNQPAGATPTPAGNNAPPAPQGTVESNTLNERSLVSGEVDLVADPRSNSILVVTRPVNFEYIKDLIRQFDQAVTLTQPLERPLKYVLAGDVLPVLQTLLTESGNQTGVPGQNGPGGQNNNRSIQNTNNNQQRNRTTSTGGGNGTGTTRTLQENEDTTPDAVMVGKTRLVADKQANSIIVIGPPESVDKVKAILDHLDKRPLQVYLSTVIGQLSIGNSSELAVDILHKYSGSNRAGAAGSLVTRASSLNGTLVDPKSLTSVSAFASLASGYTLFGTVGSALDYYVTALESTSHFRVMSRPVVYTSNNKGALISSGERIAYPSSSISDSSNSTSVVSNVSYIDVELKLEVVPLINSDREVTLQIRQTNDSVTGTTEISGNKVPTVGTQYIDTTVTVPNKGVIVLGGLITEDNSTGVTGVPILKDIPLLGYLFKGTSKSRKRSELIIMMQPVVVETNAELAEASRGEQNSNQVGEAAKVFTEKRILIPESSKRPKYPKVEETAAPANIPGPDAATGGNASETTPPAETPPAPANP